MAKSKKGSEKIIYWTPLDKIPKESFISQPKEIIEHIYYTPPQTPQEAIEKGLVKDKAIKPKNFLHHWQRLGISHKPKNWFCWWGCEGVQAVMDKDNKPTHDYYCPYWEMLALFPEWEEDFSFALADRPPCPPGGEELNEQETERNKTAKGKYIESEQKRNRERNTNPYNVDFSGQEGTRITRQSSRSGRDSKKSNDNRAGKSNTKNTGNSKKNGNNGEGFVLAKPKKRKPS